MRPQVGQLINNKYRLLRVIGDGGMGSVYEARHEGLGTTVALKFLHPELTRRSGLVQRFLQEARVSAQIQSPHVVRVTDVDQTIEGLAFIVMEFLEGKTLQALYEDLYQAGQRLSYPDALDYAVQMLDGVEAAHQAGVVHRDLKPDNVIIVRGPKGEPLLKLLDFGIAKLKVTGQADRGLTRPGVIMGTPEYMAPEQAYSADTVDARADIFSLGVIIFEMLAGRRPVGGEEPQEIASAYLSGEVAKLTDFVPGIAPELAAAIHRCMSAMPKDRFNSVSELRAIIEPFALAARPPTASNPSLAATPLPAPVTPPATNIDGQAPGAVAKTIPPEEQGPPPGVAAARNTPVGGFGSPPLGAFAQTESSPPFQPQPANTPERTSFASPLELSPRPGGTAVTDSPGGYPSPPAYGYGPGTAPMDQGYAPAPPVVANPPAYMPTGNARKQGRSGPPIALIFLLATGVAGAVVGGVHLANSLNADDEHGGDPPVVTSTPVTTVGSDPTVPQQPVPPPLPVPTTQPPVVSNPRPSTPQPKPTTTSPQPKPTTTTTATPSSQPPMIPSSLPTVLIPSSLPFPFPFPGGGGTQPAPTNTQPAPTNTQPAPTNTGPAPQPSGGIIIRPRGH